MIFMPFPRFVGPISAPPPFAITNVASMKHSASSTIQLRKHVGSGSACVQDVHGACALPENDSGCAPTARLSAESSDIYSRSTPPSKFEIGSSTIGIGPVVLHTNIEPGLPKRGLNGIMRSTIAACTILVLLIGTADAEQCPPGALGVSRTLVVDPNEHSRVGSM